MKPIGTAPRNGTPVLVRIRKDLDLERMKRFRGLYAVMRNRDDHWGWSFAAPVGMGGFPDDWLDGWWDLPVDEGNDSDFSEQTGSYR